MMTPRKIRRIFTGTPTLEGAGVHLKRAFGHAEAPLFDPFLLFDDFRSDTPAHYLQGFPWHPHRGIETITYVLAGDVEHQDSMGNKGIITAGDVQWMTAGSGIVHQEMPLGNDQGVMYGFQLWANLPASQKMMGPRYRDVKADQIPVVVTDQGATIRVVCGTVQGTHGPVSDIVIDPQYLDVALPPESTYTLPTKAGHTVIAYVIGGEGVFATDGQTPVGDGTLVLFEDGEGVHVTTGGKPVRFLFMAGKPIGEPVAWQGPIVMNTENELETAFEEYRAGTFIKQRS